MKAKASQLGHVYAMKAKEKQNLSQEDKIEGKLFPLAGLPPSTAAAMGSSELPFAGINQEPFRETKPSFNLEQG